MWSPTFSRVLRRSGVFCREIVHRTMIDEDLKDGVATSRQECDQEVEDVHFERDGRQLHFDETSLQRSGVRS